MNEKLGKIAKDWGPIAASAIAIVLSVVALNAGKEQSEAGLATQRFQAVYDRQLNLHELLAANSDVAAYVFRRAPRPRCNRPENAAFLRGKEQKRQKQCARQDAVLDYAVDFYNYVYWQIREQLPALADEDDSYIPLSLRSGRALNPPPKDLSVGDDWESWSDWSETIVAGFESSVLCEALAEEADAYDDWFLKVVFEATRLVDGRQRRAVCLDHSDADFELMLSRANIY